MLSNNAIKKAARVWLPLRISIMREECFSKTDKYLQSMKMIPRMQRTQ